MPLSKLCICISRKTAILGASAEDHSSDRLINPTESPLEVNHICSGLPGLGGGSKQARIRIGETAQLRRFYFFISR
jgi:hypothetical protein